MEREWHIRMAESLHQREQRLVDHFYKENPRFKKMIAFRLNPALEYEGMVYGFIADVNELGEMSDNESLWVPIGAMSNAGDFVLRYEEI